MQIAPHPAADLGVIVVAAGSGERLGASRPKAFVEIGGRTLIEHAIRTVTAINEPGQLVLVVPGDYAAAALELVAEAVIPEHWVISVVRGGRERHESVRFGIDALHDSIGTVLVHDAARPLTPAAVFERVTAAVRSTGVSVIPALPVVDTLKRVSADSTVIETVPREELAAVQTPQGFPREMLAAAHATAQAQAQAQESDVATGDHAMAPLPTDDAELVQRAGGTVRIVTGSPAAHKLTVASDIAILEGLLREGSLDEGTLGEGAGTSHDS